MSEFGTVQGLGLGSSQRVSRNPRAASRGVEPEELRGGEGRVGGSGVQEVGLWSSTQILTLESKRQGVSPLDFAA